MSDGVLVCEMLHLERVFTTQRIPVAKAAASFMQYDATLPLRKTEKLREDAYQHFTSSLSV